MKTDARLQITKARVVCAFVGCMILGILILGVAVWVGGSFLNWVVSVAALVFVATFGSMIRELL